jgi:hypothetical protein
MAKRKSRNETAPARIPQYEGRNNAKRKPSTKKKWPLTPFYVEWLALCAK